jgi:hypothetical protein
MRNYLYIVILFYQNVLAASPISKLDVYIYPEYYYSGVMVELIGKVEESALPLALGMVVPATTDSVFFVSGIANDESEVLPVTIDNKESNSWVRLDLDKPSFRIFVFYVPFDTSSTRKFNYTVQTTVPLDEFHVFIQEPLFAQDFTLAQESTANKDQHGITFHQIYIAELPTMSAKTISISYTNHTTQTTMVLLQQLLSERSQGKSEAAQSKQVVPQRHRLPLWEPFAVLGILAILVGIIFYNQKDYSSVSNGKKYCSGCGKNIGISDKYCTNCGGKL